MYTISQIDKNGEQYITGLLGEERFNDRGMWSGVKGFSIDINHRTQTSKVCTFVWSDGVPSNYTVIKVLKNETIGITEVDRILQECGLL